jgi:hypothetical protein
MTDLRPRLERGCLRTNPNRSEPVEPARHGGQQATDRGNLKRDQPEKILPVMGGQQIVSAVDRLEFPIDRFKLTVYRIKPPVHAVKHQILALPQPLQRGRSRLRDMFENCDASFPTFMIRSLGRKSTEYPASRLPQECLNLPLQI